MNNLNNNNLKITLADSIKMDNVLAYGIAHKFGSLADFDTLCSGNEYVEINRDTAGFSQEEVIAFYHQHKTPLLKYLATHSKNNGYICGFDWLDSAMMDSGYDRDDIAAAIYEGLIDNIAPTDAHVMAATIVVELAVDALIDAHQELMSTAVC